MAWHISLKCVRFLVQILVWSPKILIIFYLTWPHLQHLIILKGEQLILSSENFKLTTILIYSINNNNFPKTVIHLSKTRKYQYNKHFLVNLIYDITSRMQSCRDHPVCLKKVSHRALGLVIKILDVYIQSKNS